MWEQMRKAARMNVLCVSAFLRAACMMRCLLCECFERAVCMTCMFSLVCLLMRRGACGTVFNKYAPSFYWLIQPGQGTLSGGVLVRAGCGLTWKGITVDSLV